LESTKLISMNEKNYFVQFKYNGTVYQTPFLSHCDYEKVNELILEDIAFYSADEYLNSKELKVEGEVIEELTLFGKEGKILFHKSIEK